MTEGQRRGDPRHDGQPAIDLPDRLPDETITVFVVQIDGKPVVDKPVKP